MLTLNLRSIRRSQTDASYTEARQKLWVAALPSFANIPLCTNEAMHVSKSTYIRDESHVDTITLLGILT